MSAPTEKQVYFALLRARDMAAAKVNSILFNLKDENADMTEAERDAWNALSLLEKVWDNAKTISVPDECKAPF